MKQTGSKRIKYARPRRVLSSLLHHVNGVLLILPVESNCRNVWCGGDVSAVAILTLVSEF